MGVPNEMNAAFLRERPESARAWLQGVLEGRVVRCAEEFRKATSPVYASQLTITVEWLNKRDALLGASARLADFRTASEDEIVEWALEEYAP